MAISDIHPEGGGLLRRYWVFDSLYGHSEGLRRIDSEDTLLEGKYSLQKTSLYCAVD